MATAMKETELAARVVAWLRNRGLTVYQEVRQARGDCVADLVVDVNGQAWVIEVKLSLGLTVIRQAANWTRHVPRVSVAVPESKQQPGMSRRPSEDRRFAHHVCEERGIGVIEVRRDDSSLAEDGTPRCEEFLHHYRGPIVKERVRPKFRRLPRRAHNFLDCCTEAHQNYCPAGSARGGHITPYRSTMDRIAEFLREHGPATAREIIEAVEHHWSCSSVARSCVLKNILTVEEPKGWIRSFRTGKAWTFELTDKARE